jgi:hypothetical protein
MKPARKSAVRAALLGMTVVGVEGMTNAIEGEDKRKGSDSFGQIPAYQA